MIHNLSKKRSIGGVRKVFNVIRGQTGFGITLFGEKPCVVSVVAFEGNAYRAGVRSEDEIISLNGKDVTESDHDEIACIVGTSLDMLLIEVYRRKPKLFTSYKDDFESMQPQSSHHKCFETIDICDTERGPNNSIRNVFEEIQHQNLNSKYSSVRSQKFRSLVDHLQESAMLSNHQMLANKNHGPQNFSENFIKYKCNQNKLHRVTKHTIISRDSRLSFSSTKSCWLRSRRHEHKLRENFIASLHAVCDSQESDSYCLKRILGFAGSLEISEDPSNPSQRLKIVAHAVHFLESFPDKFCPVVFIVDVDEVTIMTAGGDTLLFYPTGAVRFWSLCPTNRNIFILVTQEIQKFVDGHFPVERMETFCHVFIVEPLLSLHDAHARIIREFYISCRTDLISGCCLEFPKSAIEVVECISNIYKNSIKSPKAAVMCDVLSNSGRLLPPQCNETVFTGNLKCKSPVYIVDASNNLKASDVEINIEDKIETLRQDQLASARCREHISCDQKMSRESKDVVLLNTVDCLVSSINNHEVFGCNDIEISNYNGHTKTKNDYEIFSELSNGNSPVPVILQSNPNEGSNIDELVLPTCEKSVQPLVIEKNLDIIANRSHSGTNALSSASVAADLFAPLYSKKSFVLQQSLEVNCSDDCGNKKNVSILPPLVPNIGKRQTIVKSLMEKTKTCSSVTDIENLCRRKTNFLSCKPSKGREMARRSLSAPRIRSDIIIPSLYEKCDNTDVKKNVLSPGSHNGSQLSSKSKRRLSEGISSLKLTALHLLKGGSFRDLKSAAKWSSDPSEPFFGLEDSLSHKSQREMMKSNVDLIETASIETLSKEEPSETSQIGHVSWTATFDTLLSDSTGTAVFMEFLKREYSQESLIFWLKCEEYRKLEYLKRKKFAAEIYNDHISSNGHDQINITSDIVEDIERNLAKADVILFDAAQKHIRQLLKHDKFGRFLVSDLYKSAMLAELNGKSTSILGDGMAWKLNAMCKLETRREEKNGERKRHSLVFWNRKKNGKSSSNATADFMSDNVEDGSIRGVKGQQVLENSFRVILSDGSTSVMLCKDNWKIADVLLDLGKAIEPSLVIHKVVENNTGLVIDIMNSSTSVAGKELCLQKCVLFRLKINSKSMLAIRSDPGTTVKAVFVPVLSKYGLNFDRMVIHIVDTGVILSDNTPIDLLNFKSVIAQAIDKYEDWNTSSHHSLFRKPPLPKQKSEKGETCLSPAVLHFRELFRDICQLNVDHLTFDEFGICDLTMKFSGRGKASKGGIMESLFSFMRHSSVDKLKSKSSGSLTEKMPPQLLVADASVVLPDVCKSELFSNNGIHVPTGNQVILKNSSLQLDVLLNHENSSCVTSGLKRTDAIAVVCKFNEADGAFLNKDIELHKSVSTCNLSEINSLHNDLYFEIPVLDDSFDKDMTILSTPSFIEDDGIAAEITGNDSLLNSGILPSYCEAQEYFSSIPYDTSPNYDDPLLMVKSLDDIGLQQEL